MADPIAVTATIRAFVGQVYTETAAAVQQVFQEDQINTTLKLSQVRICCGSAPINLSDGGYVLPDSTPWLAELCFGQEETMAGIQAGANWSSAGSPAIGKLPCFALQGVGANWKGRLAAAGIATVGDFMQLRHGQVVQLVQQTRSRLVLEFFAKARLAMAPLPPVPRCPLDEKYPAELLSCSPELLSQQSRVLTVAMAHHLLHYLAGLVAALDDATLTTMALRTILTP